jgi:hypothetical protein
LKYIENQLKELLGLFWDGLERKEKDYTNNGWLLMTRRKAIPHETDVMVPDDPYMYIMPNTGYHSSC